MPAERSSIIEVSDFTAAFGDVVVIDRISFEVQSGEILVILGGSGSGKSTMLKHMIGLYSPATGEISIDGDQLEQSAGADRQRILRKIGVLYQSGALFGSLTLLENVSLPLEEFTDLPSEAIDLIARMKLKLVGLDPYANHMPAEISGGMQKRAAIARAMALDPRILFLDEPSAGLDPITSAELDALVLRLRDSLGITFVVVSHELPSVFTIADRVVMLDKRTKKIVADGDPRDLQQNATDPWVRRFFNRETEDA
jgi:phospholipid/cholesterol/gamma-HCH transport system ATP-binding protein